VRRGRIGNKLIAVEGEYYYLVVPANAGTHNHRLELLEKVSALGAKTKGHGVWVPAFAGTTR
jgi:hypothetical protein